MFRIHFTKVISISLLILINFVIPLFSFELPTIEEVKKISAETNFEKYPDADEILLLNVQKIRYNPDGTGENLDDVYVKILTEKGRVDNRTIQFHFHNHYQKIEIIQAEVIKKDWSIIAIDVEKNSQISINHQQMHSNIYDPNQKILTLNVPGLEIGDILHYRYIERTIRTRMPNTWSEYLILQSDQPILDYRIEVLSPDQLPLAKFAIRDEVPGTVSFSKEKIEGYTIYRWHVRDVPQVFPEPDMPPLYTVVQRLLLSTIPNWEEVSKWYWNLCLPRLEKTSPAMEEEVKKLCEGKKSEEEKIRSLFDFVSQKIRYMGITPEEEAPGYEPHDVCLTFENKYGVCRDKAALLVSMLRLAGIKAYPVLIMAGPKKDPEVPSPYFNHAIVAVEKEKGSYLLMDMTSETTGSELLPAYLSDKSYLVAKPEGDTLRTSPIIPAEKNLAVIESNCEIRKDFSAKINTNILFTGANDNLYRAIFMRKNREQLLDMIDNILKSINSKAVYISHNILPADLSDNTSPLQLNIEFELPQLIVRGKNDSIIVTPLFSSHIGVVNFLIDKMGLLERRFPLSTEIACGTIERINITLPENISDFNFLLPQGQKIDDALVLWAQNYTRVNGKITYCSEFLLKQTEYLPAQYPLLRQYLGKREKDLASFPILTQNVKKSKDLSTEEKNTGVDILAEEIFIELESENSWTETVFFKLQLLDFSAKREVSEIKFPYNEGFTKPEVIFARVISKEGKAVEITDKEINIMDQPWTSSAPRYPRGKILVMNLPAVDIGSIIEYKVKFSHRNFPFFARIFRIEAFHPIRAKKIHVINPQKLKLKIVESANGKIAEKCVSDNELIWEFSDVSPIRKEINLPPLWASENFLSISTGDWISYRKTLIDLIEEKSHPTSEIEKLAQNLVKGKEDFLEKIQTIRDFIAENVYDPGVKFNEIPLFSIADAHSVIKRGYGTSLERAIATVSLLKTVKIPYSLILCSTTPFLARELETLKNCPQIDFINTILVEITFNGQRIYLNESDQYTELYSTPLESKTAISDREELFCEVTVPDKFRTGSEKLINICINMAGEAQICHVEKFYGTEHARWKKLITEMTPEKRRRFFQERASEIFLSSELNSAPKANFDKYPGEISIELKIANFANVMNGRIGFILPDRLKAVDQFSPFRENPYFQNQVIFRKQKYFIEFPKEFSEIEVLPEEFYYEKAPYLNPVMKISSRLQDGKDDSCSNCKALSKNNKAIVVEYEVKLKPDIFKDANYTEILSISSTFNHPANSIVVLKK